MTRLQSLLNRLGCWRFQRYRRWVGGRWIERYIEPTPHSSEYPSLRWEQDPAARFLPREQQYTALLDDTANTIGQAAGRVARSCDDGTEEWPIALPKAHVRRPK